MQIMVALPVLFKGKALRGDGIKTMLTFVPTLFDIPEIAAEDAPLTAILADRVSPSASEYRSFGEALYGSRVLTRDRTHEDGSEIIRRIHVAVAERVASKLEGVRIDDLYPKDARELIGLASKHDGYDDYIGRIMDRIAARNMEAVTAGNPDFEASRLESTEIAEREAALFLMVEGQRFQRTVGLNLKVESHYNGTVEITEEEPWNGSKWSIRPHEARKDTSEARSRYFNVADLEEALCYAEELGARLGQRVFNRTGRLRFFAPVESIPTMDWTYAEVVRSATLTACVVGSEVARRIKNREESIFTDDPALRYACDRLLDVLRDADPFGEPDERIEGESRALLDYIASNVADLDAKYRGLATNYSEIYEHLRTSLERFDNREVEFVFDTGRTIGTLGL
jgi:hypothetical protein